MNNYDWTRYDTTDNLNMNDEGVILKKILSVFSIRPTFTQISSYVQRIAMGTSNISGLSQTTFVNLPVINIRLPSSGYQVGPTVKLNDALNQVDFFIENKSLVPKNRSVIYSHEMLFFYADRKHKLVNFAALTGNKLFQRNISLPHSYIGASQLNPTRLSFEHSQSIGRETFNIKGVIALETPPNTLNIITGCSAFLQKYDHSSNSYKYLKYSPSQSAIKDEDINGDYVNNAPLTLVEDYEMDNTGFIQSSEARGCIFFYI